MEFEFAAIWLQKPRGALKGILPGNGREWFPFGSEVQGGTASKVAFGGPYGGLALAPERSILFCSIPRGSPIIRRESSSRDLVAITSDARKLTGELKFTLANTDPAKHVNFNIQDVVDYIAPIEPR